jgi:hypothetical protein
VVDHASGLGLKAVLGRVVKGGVYGGADSC